MINMTAAILEDLAAEIVTESLAVRVIRAMRPKSRCVTLHRHAPNGSSRRGRTCNWCGHLSTTWNGRWPRPKCSYTQEEEHIRNCLLRNCKKILHLAEKYCLLGIRTSLFGVI